MESTHIKGKVNIKEALRRQKRQGLSRSKIPFEEPKITEQNFIEDYVFALMNTSPQEYVGTLEHVYYSENDFRQRRQRNFDAVRGRMLNETVYDAQQGREVSQYAYLRKRNIPILSYNIISKLVRSLEGQFREINTGNVVVADTKDDKATEIASMLTTCVDRVKKENKIKNKDASNFKEQQISGRPAFKVMWGSDGNSTEPKLKINIAPADKMFMNPGVTDYDLDNLHTIGEIHDTSMNNILTCFANGNYDRGQIIKKHYESHYGDQVKQGGYSSQSFDGQQRRNQTFYTQGTGLGSYRYYEVWKKLSDFDAITYDPLDKIHRVHKYRDVEQVRLETIAENKDRESDLEGEDIDQDYKITFRTDYNSRWYVMYLTPWGKVLDVRESPFKKACHPYSFSRPDINGEIWGIVEEVLDAQKSMNRQIQQADAVVANAIKGMVFIPDTAIPDEFTPKEYEDKIKTTDGAIVYKVREGMEDNKPYQAYSDMSGVTNNIHQLIGLYSGLVDDISGNYGAAQGKSGASTASGYALETQNAGLNVRGIMEDYLGMLVERDEKILSLIIEGFSKEDYFNMTGKEIEPREVAKFRFFIEQSKGTNSPAHRLALEQELLQLVSAQLLPFDVFLQVSNNPIMIQAKQKLDEYNKAVAEQQNQQAALANQNQNAGALPQGSQVQDMNMGTREQALQAAGGSLIKQQPSV